MRLLDMTETLVVERFRKRPAVVLEAVDRPMLRVEERPAVIDLAQRVHDQLPDRDGRRNRVPRIVDGALLIATRGGEIDVAAAEDRLGNPGLPHQLRPEHADALQVGAPVQADFERAQPGPDIVDAVAKARRRVVLALRRMRPPADPGDEAVDRSKATPRNNCFGWRILIPLKSVF